MQKFRRLVTICGALALFITGAGSVLSPVHAATTQPCEISEELIGNTKHQVARMVINASPAQVQSVLTDYARTTNMFTGVKKCKVLEDNGAHKKINFIASAPGNLWTFDYVLVVHETPGYIEWHRDSGSFKENEGFWKMEPVDGGRCTMVTYAKFVDAGIIPQGLINRELRTSMPQVMSNLRTYAEQYSHVASREQAN